MFIRNKVPHRTDSSMHYACCLVAILCLFISVNTSAMGAEQYAIFTLEQEFTPLSVSKARKLYRGKTKRLEGKKIELSDWPESSEERAEFYQILLGKNTAQMNAHWASLSFSGKARPPKEMTTADVSALVQWMEKKSNRIGYAPLNHLPDDATVLFVVEEVK
ncbi:hypothetical protein VII00023_19995 [Vibrio ichthyoenteri ATCC 700023]|uniref:Phosphate ABC transporter substrate-binding protein n=2 Tax=Vibrio ichthyoenteri TaxID=142461 RepID=F9S7L3_9VIBR|nr:hypothetical protein VII00023_19995 [Vibrio ichthyoenteri ATCC 700023]